jgi:hypothetical protein
MRATRQDPARAITRFDRPQTHALLTAYREALVELRSWRDPGVAGLIVRLESLPHLAAGQLRYLDEGARTASRL